MARGPARWPSLGVDIERFFKTGADSVSPAVFWSSGRPHASLVTNEVPSRQVLGPGNAYPPLD